MTSTPSLSVETPTSLDDIPEIGPKEDGPTNKEPFLVCVTCSIEANEAKATPHYFVMRQRINSLDGTYIRTKLLFRCDVCGSERIYGDEGR
jgi:hypothetical protein